MYRNKTHGMYLETHVNNLNQLTRLSIIIGIIVVAIPTSISTDVNVYHWKVSVATLRELLLVTMYRDSRRRHYCKLSYNNALLTLIYIDISNTNLNYKHTYIIYDIYDIYHSHNLFKLNILI